MKDFAKVFYSDLYGQLAVIKKPNNEDESPDITVFIKPEGHDVCHADIHYDDDSKGRQSRDYDFDKMQLEDVERVAKLFYKYNKEKDDE